MSYTIHLSVQLFFPLEPFFQRKKPKKDRIRRQALKGQIAIATLQQKTKWSQQSHFKEKNAS